MKGKRSTIVEMKRSLLPSSLLLQSLLLLPYRITAQEELVSNNVIQSVVSSKGCTNANNLHDGMISDVFCSATLKSSGEATESSTPELIVTSAEPSIVTGMRVYAASTIDDSSYNIPISYTIEGRNNGASYWEVISNASFDKSGINNNEQESSPPGRNPNGVAIHSSFEQGDSRLTYEEAIFDGNTESYEEYRVTFPRMRGHPPNDTFALRIGELELMGRLMANDKDTSETAAPALSPAALLANQDILNNNNKQERELQITSDRRRLQSGGGKWGSGGGWDNDPWDNDGWNSFGNKSGKSSSGDNRGGSWSGPSGNGWDNDGWKKPVLPTNRPTRRPTTPRPTGPSVSPTKSPIVSTI